MEVPSIRHAPARHHDLAALGLILDNRRSMIRKDAGYWRQIARPVVHGAREFANCLLALRYRIEIAR